jgi:hypothetical protein
VRAIGFLPANVERCAISLVCRLWRDEGEGRRGGGQFTPPENRFSENLTPVTHFHDLEWFFVI